MGRVVYLEKGLLLGPQTLKHLVGLVNPSRYDERLAPDRFSLREVVAHMSDLEPVIRGRMELAVSNPGAPVANWDEDAEAIAKNYAVWEVAPTLERFYDERLRTLALYESLTEEQHRLTITHSRLGALSVYDLAVFVLGHDTYHIEQVSKYL